MCLPVCARMCVCSAVNFGHTCLKCVNFSSSCVLFTMATLRVAEVMKRQWQVGL